MNIDLDRLSRIPDGVLGFPLPVERVLYEAEQPIVYLTRTIQGQEMLAYLSSCEGGDEFVIVSPASPGSVDRLERGSLGIREALTGSWMWLVRASIGKGRLDVWSVSESDIPDLHLPRPDTPLLLEHRIAFRARAIGEGIELGSVPCSVIAFVATAAKLALKTVFDNAFEANTEGRPTDAQRALYDLPVRQLNFASFEVCLAAPAQDLFPNHGLDQAIGDLQRGLDWAESKQCEGFPEIEDEDRLEAMLRATLALTPPSHGVITSVEVGGFWLKGRTFTLNRGSRAAITKRLRQLKDEEIVGYVGRIGEIDDDKLSFTLRDLRDAEGEKKGNFPEELLEDMRLHYFEENRIEISGVVRAGKLRVTAVVNAEDDRHSGEL